MLKFIDVQVGGNHYKNFKIQPVEFIHKNNIGFIEGNIIKYICRYKVKGGIEDLHKVKHYLELLIEMNEELEHKAKQPDVPDKIKESKCTICRDRLEDCRCTASWEKVK